MANKELDPSSLLRAFMHNLHASCPNTSGEAFSIFWSGAFAGLALEAGLQSTRALHTRHQQLHQHISSLVSLRGRWCKAAARQTAHITGTYRGARGALAAGTLWSGVFGFVYVPVRAAVDATAPKDQTAWGPVVAASAGSAVSSSIRVPLQVVKGRIDQGEFCCSLKAFQCILAQEGPFNLYSGWARRAAKNLPFDALLFLFYDMGKSQLLVARQQQHCGAHMLDPELSGARRTPSGKAAVAAAAKQSDPVPDSLAAPLIAVREEIAPPYRSWDAAVIGAAAGAAAGLLTSPLDLLQGASLRPGASQLRTKCMSEPAEVPRGAPPPVPSGASDGSVPGGSQVRAGRIERPALQNGGSRTDEGCVNCVQGTASGKLGKGGLPAHEGSVVGGALHSARSACSSGNGGGNSGSSAAIRPTSEQPLSGGHPAAPAYGGATASKPRSASSTGGAAASSKTLSSYIAGSGGTAASIGPPPGTRSTFSSSTTSIISCNERDNGCCSSSTAGGASKDMTRSTRSTCVSALVSVSPPPTAASQALHGSTVEQNGACRQQARANAVSR
ncbi:hypothetical protein VaNZ11_003008, partial [Volvox africanus]